MRAIRAMPSSVVVSSSTWYSKYAIFRAAGRGKYSANGKHMSVEEVYHNYFAEYSPLSAVQDMQLQQSLNLPWSACHMVSDQTTEFQAKKMLIRQKMTRFFANETFALPTSWRIYAKCCFFFISNGT